jgi:hypothetical protein
VHVTANVTGLISHLAVSCPVLSCPVQELYWLLSNDKNAQPCVAVSSVIILNYWSVYSTWRLHCKLNTFGKRVKNVVTSKGIEVGVECK